jgi:uncharacterized protein with ParB-like and HNH nuclease domain
LPKFKNTEAALVGLIFDQNTSIIVPDYQRNYSWGTDEDNKQGCKICDLWNDLVEKYNDFLKDVKKKVNGEYLLGPMVFVDKTDQGEVEIVDGQQRLATLTTLFCAARDIILELDPDTKYSDMISIHKLIENSTLKGRSGEERVWISWKLTLNEVDKTIFEKYIQTYKVEEPEQEEILDQQGDKYYKNSKKVQFFEKEIKDNKSEYSDSEILLFEAYIDLSKKINDNLIIDFESSLDVKNELDDIDKKAEEEADKNIRDEPKKYLGDTQEEFFNHIEKGLIRFEQQSWPSTKKQELEKELNKKNIKNKAQGKDPQSWDTFIKNRMSNMKSTDKGGLGSYQTVLKEQTDITKTANTKQRKKDHLPSLITFCAGIVEQIYNVKVTVRLEEDAYQIFESLNDKGQSLSKSNLIKNWIIKIIHDESKKKTWSGKWNDMITSLNQQKPEIDVDKFLRASLLSRGHKNDSGKFVFGEFPIANSTNLSKVTSNNFYRIIKAKITSEALAIKYIENLIEDSKIRIQFNSPKTNFPDSTVQQVNQHRDPKPALMDMAFLDAEYILIPILTAYRKWKPSSDEFTLLVKVLVAFFFRYKVVSKLSASNIEKIAFTASSVIANGTSGEEKTGLFKIIKFVLQYDNSSLFENQWKEKFDPPGEDNAKFVLKHIESHLMEKTDDTEPIEGVQIEHILPQKAKEDDPDPTKVWNKDQFFRGYVPAPGAIPRDFRRWHKKLGNLTNLNSVVNKKLSNHNFVTKLNHKDAQGNYDGYLSSNLIINKETVCKDQDLVEKYEMWGLTDRSNRTEWTHMDIYNRGEYFKELATEIWELPKIVCESTTCENHTIHQDIAENTIEKLSAIKCEKCNKDLTIKWPTSNGPEYRAPSDYQQ